MLLLPNPTKFPHRRVPHSPCDGSDRRNDWCAKYPWDDEFSSKPICWGSLEHLRHLPWLEQIEQLGLLCSKCPYPVRTIHSGTQAIFMRCFWLKEAGRSSLASFLQEPLQPRIAFRGRCSNGARWARCWEERQNPKPLEDPSCQETACVT